MRTILAVALALSVSAATLRSAVAGSAEDLGRQQEAVERHLLRVQRERFEARARGDDPKKLKRLEREFDRTYQRRNAVLEEQKQAQ
jgi:hypothetical protein